MPFAKSAKATPAPLRVLAAALCCQIDKGASSMSFDDFMTDSISILKKDGKRLTNLRASVQSQEVLINRSDILIETGDLIERTMSNGGVETFEVIDPGFQERFHGIEAHYQMKVKKLGIPE